MNWNCSLVWKLNPTATCEIRDQPCQMPWSLWLPVADSATSLMWHELQQHFQSFFSFFFFFLNTNSSFTGIFSSGKSLPAPLRDATTPSVDGLYRDLARCHGTGAHSPDVKVISRPCFVSCIPFTSSWVKPHEPTGSWWLYINCTDFSGNKNKSCSLLTEQGWYSLGEREELLKWL